MSSVFHWSSVKKKIVFVSVTDMESFSIFLPFNRPLLDILSCIFLLYFDHGKTVAGLGGLFFGHQILDIFLQWLQTKN